MWSNGKTFYWQHVIKWKDLLLTTCDQMERPLLTTCVIKTCDQMERHSITTCDQMERPSINNMWSNGKTFY